MEPGAAVEDSYPENDKEIQDIVECTKKIRLDSRDSSNYVDRSRCFMKLSQYFYALEDARKVTYDLCPKSPIGYKLISEIYSHAELYENAIKFLEFGYNACGQEFKEYKRLKNIAQRKLELLHRGEKMLLLIFLLLGIGAGVAVVFLKKRYIWPGDQSQTANVVIIFSFPLLSAVMYFFSRHIRRRRREVSVDPPYDIIGDSDMQSMRSLCPELSESLGDKKAF